MSRILIIGGGLAGCITALELAKGGRQVIIIEKADRIGGKVRDYGCKATISCNNCGLCLTGGLWEQVENNENITILKNTKIIDISGKKGSFNVVAIPVAGSISRKDSGSEKQVINTEKQTTNSSEEQLMNSRKHMINSSEKQVINTEKQIISDIDSIIVTIGFNNFSSISHGNYEINHAARKNAMKQKADTAENRFPIILSGTQLEQLLLERTSGRILPEDPKSIAFIQCFGSRDAQEKAGYCSRVCCAYSTRAARVLRQYYPNTLIKFFYMDLQQVNDNEYMKCLNEEKIDFVRCRPVKISIAPVAATQSDVMSISETAVPVAATQSDRGSVSATAAPVAATQSDKMSMSATAAIEAGSAPASDTETLTDSVKAIIRYEKTEGGIAEESFGLIVLSEGVHPAEDVEYISEICRLGVDNNGFLKYVRSGNVGGVYIAGCASGPKRIEEVYTEALTLAREILAS